ncbi:MAG: hypothetical protein AAF960_02120 [Bacteroidota bacterium]
MKKHFHTYQKIFGLLPFLLLGFITSVSGQARQQFEFKIQYMIEQNDSTWGVFVRPADGFAVGSNDAVVGSGQVTILMFNDGTDSISNITSVSGDWNTNYDMVRGPTEATNITYFFVGMRDGDGINLENGEETLLFTFKVPRGCPDTLGLINNNTDPFNSLPNSVGNNPGMDLSTFNSSTGRVHNWLGNYNERAYSCGDCDSDGIVDGIEDTNGNGVFDILTDSSAICDVCDPLGVNMFSATLSGGDTLTMCGEVNEDSVALMVDLTGGWSPFIIYLESTKDITGEVDTLVFTNYEVGDRIYVAPDTSTVYRMVNITDSPPTNAQGVTECTINPDSLFETVRVTVEGPLTRDDDGNPYDFTACSLDTLGFGVKYSNGGEGIIQYQWQFSTDDTNWSDVVNGTPYAFADTDSMIISNPLGLDGYYYRAKVFTETCDTLYSESAQLSVDGPFIFDTQPTDQIACAEEDPIYFHTLTSVGQGTFSRRWQVNRDDGAGWVDVNLLDGVHRENNTTTSGGPGIENIYEDTLFIDVPTFDMNQWEYRIAAIGQNTTTCEEVYSDEALLTVEGRLIIDVQPIDVSVCSDTVACFGVTVTNQANQGEVNYQWYVQERGTTTWTAISNDGTYSGTRSDTLCVTNVLGRDSFAYRVEIRTTHCAIVTSDSAYLNVDGPINFVNNAQDVTVCADEDPNIFAVETHMGQGILDRRWQVNRNDGAGWVDLTIVDTFSVGVDSAANPVAGFEKAYFDTLYIDTAAFYMDQWQFRLAAIGQNSGSCEDIYSDEAILTVEGVLTVDVQPVDVSICSDTVACFGVTIGSQSTSGLIEYQWYVQERGVSTWTPLTNDGTYSGVRSDTLCVTNVLGRDSFAYRVDVRTSACAIITSDAALLRIDGPISYNTNADDVTVCAGEDPNFFAYETYMGQGVLDRRWQVNRNDGAGWVDLTIVDTFSTTVDSVDNPVAGFEIAYYDTLFIDTAAFYMNQWQFRLASRGQNSNNCTDTYSREAILTVEGQISVSVQPLDVALCSDTAACFGVQIFNEADEGIVQYQWYKLDKGEDPNVDANWEVLSSSDGRYAGVRSDTLCVLFISGQDSTQYRVGITTNLCSEQLSDPATLNVDGPIEYIVDPQDETICADEDAIYFTSAASIGQGGMVTRWEISTDTGNTWTPITYGGIYSRNNSIGEDPSTGTTVDSIYFDTLFISSVDFMMDHYHYRNVSAGITGNGCDDVNSGEAILTVEGLISITVQPIDVSICSDTAACFGVSVANQTGQGNIRYQWQAQRPGTSSWITLTSSDGRYGGVTSDTLCVNNVANLDSFLYRVYIYTNTCANQYSDSARLNVSGPIIFDNNPQDVTVCAAEDQTFFAIEATIGQGGLTNRWQVNQSGTWEDVDLNEAIYSRNSSKEANPALSIDSTYYDTLFLDAAATAGMDQWQYRIVANGLNGESCKDIPSDAATLTVHGPLHVDTNPSSDTICSGSPAIFVVETTNDASGTVRYQWQKKTSIGTWADLTVGDVYNGVRDSILSISDVARVVAGQSGADSAFYRVAIFTNNCDRIYSDSAQLRVEGPFVFDNVEDSPSDTIVCAGEQIIFSANPTNYGFGEMIYEWYVSINGSGFGPVTADLTLDNGGSPIYTGANTTQLIINPTTAAQALALDSAYFRLDVTSTECLTGSSSLRALLRIDGDIVIDQQPRDTVNCADKGVIFFVNATNNGYTGAQGIQYRWQEYDHETMVWSNIENEGVYNGATTDTLSIDITTGLDSNQYRVVMWTSVCNEIISDAAYLIEEGSAGFVDQPDDVIICSGEATSFTTVMENSTGQGVNVLNWQISTNNGISWTNVDTSQLDIDGNKLFVQTTTAPMLTPDPTDSTVTTMSTTLDISNVAGMQGYRFRGAVTSTFCDTVFSQLARLTVEGPFIATLSGDNDICANIGTTIIADVTNLGAGLPELTWQYRSPDSTNFIDVPTTWDIFQGERTNGVGTKVLTIDSVLNQNSRENLPTGVDTFFTLNNYDFRLHIVSDTCDTPTFSDTFNLRVVADTIGRCDWDLDGLDNTTDLDDDNDGLTDSVEYYITTYAGSEPQDSVAQFDTDTDNNNVTDDEEDADEDTISNGEEVDDDDGDGLSDGVDSLTGVFTGFPAMPDPSDEDPDDIFNGDPLDPCDPILSPSCIGVVLDINVKLAGAMPELGTADTSDAVLMIDSLRRQALIPRVSPYKDFFVLDSLNTLVPAFPHVERDSVVEEIPSGDSTAVFGTNGFYGSDPGNAVVDWVFVEIRDGSKLDSVVTTRAALLQRDGDVRDHRPFTDPRKMDADGYSYLTFDSTLAGDYYVVVRHRNHLGVMTNEAGLYSPIVERVDFTDKDFNALGIHSQKMNADSTEQYMWAGDVTSDRKVIYQGPGNDIDEMFFRVIASPGNVDNLDNYIVPGYYRTDYNLDGNSIFQGPDNDRQMLIFNSILRFPDNRVKFLANYVILEQLP